MDNQLRKPSAGIFSHRTLRLWFAALAVAFALDGPVARLCQPIAPIVKQSEIAEELKEGGHFVFVVIVAIFIWILHPQRLRGAMLLCISGITSGLFNSTLKWVIGRPRPVILIDPFRFEPFAQGLHGLFHLRNLAFPSGHACLAFATAACLSHLLPRGKWAFYLAAGLIGAERVAELAHYLSDSVAGAGLGVLAFHVALRLCDSIDIRLGARSAASTAS